MDIEIASDKKIYAPNDAVTIMIPVTNTGNEPISIVDYYSRVSLIDPYGEIIGRGHPSIKGNFFPCLSEEGFEIDCYACHRANLSIQFPCLSEEDFGIDCYACHRDEKHWVDTIAPTISNVKVSPTYALPGDSITISAKVFDSSGVKWVRAYINKDGELVGTVFMSDPDKDRIYTGTWQTIIFTESGTYNIDICAIDTVGNEVLVLKAVDVEIT